MSLENKIRVVVSGAYTESDGYPNVKWFLHCIANDSRFEIVARVGAKNKIKSASLYKLASGNFIDKIGNFLLELFRNIKSFTVVIFVLHKKDYDFLYIPYPALISLLLHSLLQQLYCCCSRFHLRYHYCCKLMQLRYKVVLCQLSFRHSHSDLLLNSSMH